MNTLLIISFTISSILIYLFYEYRTHLKKLRTIPIRIHVNGSRGKSSVTRLMASALKEAGFKVFAKTTGTQARVITEEGIELPVYRLESSPNIIEQLRVVDFAAKNKAEVLVVECMALNPNLTYVTELNMIQSTHGVITNVRADHLDVMGPTERDVALALLGMTPKDAKLFTAERDYVEEFKMACEDRNSDLAIVSSSEVEEISDEEMSHFSYEEHKENVALVLKICNSLNVPKNVALKGMYKVTPDVGAMNEYHIDYWGREIVFINGFAANDPESSEKIWNNAVYRYTDKKRKIMVINTRADRLSRSVQIGETLAEWKPADKYIIIGNGCYVLIKKAVDAGLNPSQIINAEGLAAPSLFEIILEVCDQSAMVMGIGNIKGVGMNLIRLFKNRSKLMPYKSEATPVPPIDHLIQNRRGLESTDKINIINLVAEKK